MRRHLAFLGRGLIFIIALLVVPFLISPNWGVFLLVLYLLPGILLIGSGLESIASIVVIVFQTLCLAYIVGRQKPFLKRAIIFIIMFYAVEFYVGIILIGIMAVAPGL